MKYLLIFFIIILISCGRVDHKVRISDSKQTVEVNHRIDLEGMFDQIDQICVSQYEQEDSQKACVEEFIAATFSILTLNRDKVEDGKEQIESL